MSRTSLVALTLLTLMTPPAGAAPPQTTAQTAAADVDARWLPWIGCWRPADQSSFEEHPVRVCVVPAGNVGVRVLTLSGATQILDETIVADGSDRPVDEVNCRGSRRTQWSADGQRLFAKAELTCDRQPSRTVSAITLLTPDAEWLDIQTVTARNQESVRVRRYQRTTDEPPDPSLIPAAIAARAATAARGSRLTVNHVIEANGKVSRPAIEALLFETHAHFPLSSKELIALDDAGVPDPVIDLMVALSFPSKFEIKRSRAASNRGYGPDGFGWVDIDAGPLFNDPYYSFYSPFGYARWGYWNENDYWPGTDVFVKTPDAGGKTPRPSHGQIVNGTGYVQVAPRPDGSIAKKGDSGGGDGGASASSSSSGSSSGSNGSSGGSVSSSGYSGSSDSGRTAVPR